jgi:hypothetical protein
MKFNEKYFDELLEKNRSQNSKMNISDLIVVVWLDHVGELNNSEYVGFQDLKNFESVMSQKISEVEDESERKRGFGSLVEIVSSLTHSRKQLERVNRIHQIFLDQEESYEIPRFGSLMEEFVTERVPEISNGEKSYYDFVVSLYQVFDSRIHDLLSDLDNYLENYSSVRNEREEDVWDQVFESKFLTLLNLIDQNR